MAQRDAILIRKARPDDIPALLSMGYRFHAATAKPIRYDYSSVAELLSNMIRDDNRVLLVADDGEIVGMFGARVFASDINRDILIFQERFWWSERAGAGRLLLDEAERIARAVGAGVIMMGDVAGMREAAMDRLYLMRGYHPLERTYIRRIR